MIQYICNAIVLLYITWIFYLAVMNLAKAKNAGTLSPASKFFGYPVLVVGITLDALSNIFVMTPLFLELPKELLVTARVKRHLYQSTGWREKVAGWFCKNLLNAFDPDGKHC